MLDATKVAIVTLIRSRFQNNQLAEHFPERCNEGCGIVDTDIRALSTRIVALIPGLEWPLSHHAMELTDHDVFDLVEFVDARISTPIEGYHHSYSRHFSLSFDRQTGVASFRNEINELLSRGGTVFELASSGQVVRLGTPEVRAMLSALQPDSGDIALDGLIEQGRSLYASRNQANRGIAIEKLWDAFERLKTIELAADKKLSVEALLSHIPDMDFREVINSEMRSLTSIGNGFQIRHHEVEKIPVPESAQDYLVGRMANLLVLLLQASGRLATQGQSRRGSDSSAWPLH